MNVLQLRKVLTEVARQKEQVGNDDAVNQLKNFAELLKKHDKKSVIAVAGLIKSLVK